MYDWYPNWPLIQEAARTNPKFMGQFIYSWLLQKTYNPNGKAIWEFMAKYWTPEGYVAWLPDAVKPTFPIHSSLFEAFAFAYGHHFDRDLDNKHQKALVEYHWEPALYELGVEIVVPYQATKIKEVPEDIIEQLVGQRLARGLSITYNGQQSLVVLFSTGYYHEVGTVIERHHLDNQLSLSLFPRELVNLD